MDWNDKYRPTTLEGLAGCGEFLADAYRWRSDDVWPATLLLSGPPGVGKTAAAMVIAREMQGDYFGDANCIVTNASDDRGIDFVRSELKQAAVMGGLGCKRKVILLDEADGLTPAAQDALRQVIETTTNTALFILTANHPEKLKQPIRDRCRHYRFPPHAQEGAGVLERIAAEEGLPEAWSRSFASLILVCDGSLRRAISVLQSLPREDSALTEAVKTESAPLSDAALAVVGEDLPALHTAIYKAIDTGGNRFQVLKGLQFRVRSLLNGNDYYAFVRTWGEFMDRCTEWPADDRSFFDYFVAVLDERRN